MPDAATPAALPPLSPEDVVAIAAPAGRRVLLVGCSDGQLGQALLAGGASEVVGLDGCARALARSRLTAVLAMDPDAAPELPWPAGYFDLVVLEDFSRLLAPVPALAHLRRWLADEGRLVAVVPNVLHEAVAAALLTSGRLPSGAGTRPLSVGDALDALDGAGFQVEDDVVLVRTEAGAAAPRLASLATALGADPRRVTDGLTLVRAVLAARPREQATASAPPIPDPWRGSRPVKVLVTPDLKRADDSWAEALHAMARAFATHDNVTLGLTLPAEQLDAPPPALAAAVAGVPCDLVLIEEPADEDGWARLFAGAGTWVKTSPRPLQLALARSVGVQVQAP
ncbi:MAG TPA: methyltransferase domain-containing protein [Anaeromyxobacteraceae bacterium]|nr:methyltransferase domain-containing protein [Anaeromyxobacteraceae bacterium]